MTSRADRQPRIEHADLVTMEARLSDGTVIPITVMYDANGRETDDGDRAASFVAGPYETDAGPRWVAVSLNFGNHTRH